MQHEEELLRMQINISVTIEHESAKQASECLLVFHKQLSAIVRSFKEQHPCMRESYLSDLLPLYKLPIVNEKDRQNLFDEGVRVGAFIASHDCLDKTIDSLIESKFGSQLEKTISRRIPRLNIDSKKKFIQYIALESSVSDLEKKATEIIDQMNAETKIKFEKMT